MADYSDPKQGGDLSDMAATGTTVPGDAGKQNLIPSKPRPDQIADQPNPNDMGGSTLATAADNQGDISRVGLVLPSTPLHSPFTIFDAHGSSFRRAHKIPPPPPPS